jgi:hypothetical protein
MFLKQVEIKALRSMNFFNNSMKNYNGKFSMADLLQYDQKFERCFKLAQKKSEKNKAGKNTLKVFQKINARLALLKGNIFFIHYFNFQL